MNFTIIKKKQVEDLRSQLKLQAAQIEEATQLIEGIKSNSLKSEISALLTQSRLGIAIRSIREHLQRLSKQEEERNWANGGLAKFSDILRNKDAKDLNTLANELLSTLVKYLDVNQGALFIIHDDEESNPYLEMVACYAYERRKFITKRINPGEGLVGQCMLEQEPIYLKVVPKSYINITSGLGEATPEAVFISPLIVNEKVFGVLELASFHEIPAYKIEFIKRLSENIAGSIKNVRESDRVLSLLNASQQQAEELRSQEEEMRQNMEELQATQEEIKRRSDELARTSADMLGIVTGVNATMATIEFTPDGKIITANANFLKVMKYELHEIKGKHHREFVPADIRASIEYASFWEGLAKGRPLTGKFRRVSSDGNMVWLNAIYNPVFDETGNVTKVVKFATDITKEQELMAESTAMLHAINATMATVDFSPRGEVITANKNFLKTMECNLQEIQGKYHKIFVPEEILDSLEYQMFWKRLAGGESMSGVFKRRSLKGNVVWLNAIYNPIANANGEVIKIVKFATDISASAQLFNNSTIVEDEVLR